MHNEKNHSLNQRGALLPDSACYMPPLLGAQDHAVETAKRVECDAYQKPELCWAVFHFPGDTQTHQHTTESLARDIILDEFRIVCFRKF